MILNNKTNPCKDSFLFLHIIIISVYRLNAINMLIANSKNVSSLHAYCNVQNTLGIIIQGKYFVDINADIIDIIKNVKYGSLYFLSIFLYVNSPNIDNIQNVIPNLKDTPPGSIYLKNCINFKIYI